MIVRCTKKLLTVIRPPQLVDQPPDGEDWYANLLWLSGRKCLLLTHAATLFTVFEADVRAAGLRAPGRLVGGLISRELLREQLPADTFGNLDPIGVVLAKTADRSVLGCMKDMAFLCETVTIRSGGLATTDIGYLNQALRRNINSARGYQPPIELTAARVAPVPGESLRAGGMGRFCCHAPVEYGRIDARPRGTPCDPRDMHGRRR
jgi:hypothetical protein